MRKLLASIAVLCLVGWNFPAFAASAGGGSGGGAGISGGGGGGGHGGGGGGGGYGGGHGVGSHSSGGGSHGSGNQVGDNCNSNGSCCQVSGCGAEGYANTLWNYPGVNRDGGGRRIVPSGTGKIDGQDAQLFTVALRWDLESSDVGKLKRQGWYPHSYGGDTYYCNPAVNTCFRIDPND